MLIESLPSDNIDKEPASTTTGDYQSTPPTQTIFSQQALPRQPVKHQQLAKKKNSVSKNRPADYFQVAAQFSQFSSGKKRTGGKNTATDTATELDRQTEATAAKATTWQPLSRSLVPRVRRS